MDATKLATRELTLGVDVSAPFQAGGLDGVAWGGVAAVKRFDDTQAVQSAAFRAGSERFKVYSADMGDTRAQYAM
ncbi:autotransporter domain-containing protein [Pusillimonas minor]|uniref:Autotransporter domain-containing protein n=1 Tax=Pusillimonas minor TaxID=2697024 RepID=A0A842HRC5_9BURK|nr:autotransporter domain-containing protein [Pusillimonas minor]